MLVRKADIELLHITPNAIDRIYEGYRICYSKDTNSIHLDKHNSVEQKCEFIKPLLFEKHTSPMEHIQATFMIKNISRAALAQITRHRTFSFNVQSQRYVHAKNFNYYLPPYLTDFQLNAMAGEIKRSLSNYEYLINETEMSKEDARGLLPQAITCNLLVTVDMNNFRNFLRQRMCQAAQFEIREIAKQMAKLVNHHIPFITQEVLLCGKECNRCHK